MRDDQTSSRVRVDAWVRQHQRAVGIGVAVSALALIGIAVALGWAFFSDRSQTGQVDATPTGPVDATPTAQVAPSGQPTAEPSVSSEPSASAAPSATPGLAWPPVGEAGYRVSGRLWAVSAVNDLNIRSGPGAEYPAVGQLDEGDIALVLIGALGPDWVEVAADGVIGFANIGPEGDRYLLSTPTPWQAYFTTLRGVASNSSTYVAYGMGSEHEYVPYEGGDGPLVLVSDDGVTWSRPPEGPPGSVTAVAGGATGFVALTVGSMTPSFAAFSADGRTWEEPEVLGGSSVAYGPAGWVIVGGDVAWRSIDGRSWEEAGVIGLESGAGSPEIEASDAGYVVFQRHCCAQPWASVDGASWGAIDLPIAIDDWVSDVELIGDRVLVLAGDAQSGESLLHRGRLSSSGAVTWDAAPGPIDSSSLRVASISHGPDGLLATGWDSEQLVPVLWRSADGTSWERLNASTDALGGSVGLEPAWGPAGWVGLGATVDGAGQQLWRSPDGEAWEPTGEPILHTSPMPPCPPAGEVSILVLMYLSPFADRCFGDASFTVRGWLPMISYLGDGSSGTPEPDWLARSWGAFVSPGDVLAGSGESMFGVWATLSLHIPPGVDSSALQGGRWIEIVGHFRDEAAASCRIRPPIAQSQGGEVPSDSPAFLPHLLESPASVQRDCLQRFVAESITAVDGP